MSILGKFTVTPLLYACGALLLVCLGLGVALKLKDNKLDLADAQLDTMVADRRATITERDAWKGKAEELIAANGAYGHALGVVRTELQRCQGDAAEMSQAQRKAIDAARAEAADADRTLEAFLDQFKTATHGGNCGLALRAMQAACPSLEGY